MKPNIKTSLVAMTTKVTEGQQVFKLSCHVVFGLKAFVNVLASCVYLSVLNLTRRVFSTSVPLNR